MRKLFILMVLLLFLVGCTKGDEVASKLDQYNGKTEKPLIDDLGPTEFVRENETVEKNETVDWEPGEDDNEESAEEEKEPQGEAECTTDSKGVVRMIYPDGNKEVYRDDCQPNGVVIKYKCSGNKVKDEAIVCSSGLCKSGAYGDTCVL